MESATSTNTGHKGVDSSIALAMAKGRAGQALVLLLQNRQHANTISGTVVAAGGNLATVTITPKFTGKFRVSWFGSWAAPGAGVVTPQIRASQGGPTGPEVAIAQFGNTQASIGGSIEIDGFLVNGSSCLFNLQTTAGDAAITLGQGVAASGAGLLVEELP
jgi:hypothetical protein